MKQLLLYILFCVSLCSGKFLAGVSKVDGTLPIGVPLAGYNYAPRSVPLWPIPSYGEYTTWMNPSQGIFNPTWVKAVVIDNGVERLAFISMEVIAADQQLEQLAHDIAVTKGFTVPIEKCLFSAIHTHSGPGAISNAFLWAVVPATDLAIPELQRRMAESIADAMVRAELGLGPASMDIGIGNLTGVTHNDRSGMSPYVHDDTIDPHLGVIRIDDMYGKPLATIWNYAIHGICYDAPNMNFSSDIMGSVNDWIEQNIGGVSLFINGDAGDIHPIFGVVCKDGPHFSGGPIIGKAVQQVYQSLKPTDEISLASNAIIVPFGRTNLNLTLSRVANCNTGGPLDLCGICTILNCDENIHLPSSWIPSNPRFSAFRFDIHGTSTVMVSIPGEALIELGWQIRNDTQDLKFDQTLLAGYSNEHMGYFATANEYDIGGYESLLTFWGIDTADQVRAGCKAAATPLSPQKSHK